MMKQRWLKVAWEFIITVIFFDDNRLTVILYYCKSVFCSQLVIIKHNTLMAIHFYNTNQRVRKLLRSLRYRLTGSVSVWPSVHVHTSSLYCLFRRSFITIFSASSMEMPALEMAWIKHNASINYWLFQSWKKTHITYKWLLYYKSVHK